MAPLLIVLVGAALLFWPALLNGYPLVFSDTGGFLEQALMPDMGWDKPWIYGPFLTPFHAQISLWPAAFAQATILSAAVWLTQAVALRGATAAMHLALCTLLAAGSAAPWFAATLMPDIFAPIVVLGLFILAYGAGRMPRLHMFCVAIVATIAIASHLAHLILAAACIAMLTVLRWRTMPTTAAPLAAALALLLLSNIVGNGVAAISPYGATFALARLVADGPARDFIDHACPHAQYRLCAWKGRLPTDSDQFLWDPYGPVWAEGYGPIRIAPEAAQIVRATLIAEPAAVLRAALRNTLQQLVQVDIGDTLGSDHLVAAVLPRLQAYFPPEESNRFAAGLQAQGALRQHALPFNALYEALLIIGAAGALATAIHQRRRNPALGGLSALVFVALLANAFATGALSGPHDRYQARIAWLVLLPPALALSQFSTNRTRRRRP
jgi:hypothetical protein